ncbi:hypothetical protein DLJ53_26630 [Acuticoccus sediminis]|uniref:GAF domain-containing protein n=1 Tax=Acuticoccus sediminis TaxID=2184697 RepID=A0A8B2NNI8_9HYPH|nr:GAF domain-containing protein [Acuticoccus sediminis]RAH98287.1 hypothetical protein DLJ53_26630 [Acuticoccus sediminis]
MSSQAPRDHTVSPTAEPGSRRQRHELAPHLSKVNLPWPIAVALMRWLGSEQHETILRLARQLVDCPIAFVSTMVDADHGCAGGAPQGNALCAKVHDSGDTVFVVPDASKDPHFTEDLLVHGYPHARFFAGAPIRIQDHAVGTLFVLDYGPREALEEDIVASFAMLARFAGQSVEVMARTLSAPSKRAQLEAMADRSNVAVLNVSSTGKIERANRAACLLLRMPHHQLVKQSVQDFVVGWNSLVGVMMRKALNAADAHAEKVKPLLVEVTTQDGAITPSRASIVCQLDAGLPRYRVVLEELP